MSPHPRIRLSAQSPRHEGVLAVDDRFPRLAGEALSGKPVEIPRAVTLKPTVVLFSFSKAGGADARLWDDRLRRDVDSTHADIMLVVDLHGVPRLIRGLVTRGIRQGVPPEVRDQMLVLQGDDAVWKHRLSVTTPDSCYAVLVAPDGRIRWMSGAGYSGGEFARLRAALGG